MGVAVCAVGILVSKVHGNQLGADMKTYQVWSSETVVYMKEVKANTEEDAKNQILSELSGKGKSYGTSNFKINTVNEIKES
jgi:ribosomal protein L20A (L18A)